MAKYYIPKSRLMQPTEDEQNKKRHAEQKKAGEQAADALKIEKVEKNLETNIVKSKAPNNASKEVITEKTNKREEAKKITATNKMQKNEEKQRFDLFALLGIKRTHKNRDAHEKTNQKNETSSSADDILNDMSYIRRTQPQKKHKKSLFPQLPMLPQLPQASGWLADAIDLFTGILGAFLIRLRESRSLLLGIIAGGLFAFIIILIMEFYSVQKLSNFKPSVTTKVYDKNGILITEFFQQKRDLVPFDKIPLHVRQAFIAIEDADFYSHWGINPKGIVRAFFINIFAGRIKQGGSTITQQLAKILLTSRKRSLYRKIKEAFIAIMIEMKFSKDEILNLYLNQIYLGHGAHGVETASQFYFKKHASELTLAQGALLATLPPSPNHLSPIRQEDSEKKVSKARLQAVLSRMAEQGFISVKDAEDAFDNFWDAYLVEISDLSPTVNVISSKINKAPWFTEYIRRKLVKKYGENMLFNKGLHVYTTLDVNKQMAAQEILEKALIKQTKISSKLAFKNDDYIYNNFYEKIDLVSMLFDLPEFKKKGSRQNEKFNNYIQKNLLEEIEGLNFIAGFDTIDEFLDKYKTRYLYDKDFLKVEGCIISIDHNTGHIEAMVGGSEFTSINQLNRIIQSRRQPGSSIKPLLYAAAMESGKFTPASTILDSPIIYLDNDGGDWLPENYEGSYNGLVRLRQALALSINVVSIKIAETLGIDTVIKYYGKFLKFNQAEINRRIPRNFSVALGSLEVSPFELTRAYAIIANGGKEVIPYSIRYIKDNEGNILENREEDVLKLLEEKRKKGTLYVIQPATAQIMISMLGSVVNGGTGSAARTGMPTAGKTGTTNNYKDAWFVGFTPCLTTGLWIGYDGKGLSLGIGQSGGSIAAPVWGEYMRKAMSFEKRRGFPGYAGLTVMDVCKRTGLLPTSDCKETIKEHFIPGFVPKKDCDLCSKVGSNDKIMEKGPQDNISQKQKNSIINNLKKDNKKVIDDIDNLLD